MRKAARTDQNQPEIVAALRKAGASVEPLARVGGGCPDLLCGFRGANFLLEVKHPDEAVAKYRERRTDEVLTPDQVKWINSWKGGVHVVWDVQQALEAIGAVKPRY